MGNEKNLRPQSERTPEERSRIAKMGQKASVEKRRQKKAMKEFAEYFGSLDIDVKLANGKVKKTTYDGAVIFTQYQKAIKEGSVKSAMFLAQLKGEMEQNVNITSDQQVILVRSDEEKQKIEDIDKLDV